MNPEVLTSRLEKLPKVVLNEGPTPIQELRAFSRSLGGPKVYVKRDDLATLALGGNKVRKLEYVLGQAQALDTDTIVTGGALQSNHCRATAAAAAKLGLKCVLILKGQPGAVPQGNYLLDRLFGADVHFLETESMVDVESKINSIAADFRKKGRRPYAINVVGGPASVYGVIAYVETCLEMFRQLEENKTKISHIVVCTGSGSTQAGLLLGAKILKREVQVIGISIRRDAADLREKVRNGVVEACRLLEVSIDLQDSDLHVYDQYIGAGYGLVTPDVREAITRLALTEGLLIDPVYAGKALCGLIDLITTGKFGNNDTVMFIHTGGIPALFAYNNELV